MAGEAAVLIDEKNEPGPQWVPAATHDAVCQGAIARTLAGPVDEFLSRPCKRFRARLVSCGARLITRDWRGDVGHNVAVGAEAIELLHAGSLIVDDVQDGSAARRGKPSFHALHGVPLAVCGGNWLYFRALSLLAGLRLGSSDALAAITMLTAASEEAHQGQALDLSLRPDELPQAEIVPLAGALLELKTGSITALALGLGAKLAGGSEDAVAAAQRFGRRFGVALQLLDDFGNLLATTDDPKVGEDLRRNRLTGVWLQVALRADAPTYDDFVATTRRLRAATPDDRRELAAWLDRHGFTTHARSTTRWSLVGALHDLAHDLGLPSTHETLTDLRSVAEAMTHAYD